MNNKSELRVYPDGHKEWFLNDKRHREDGPAVECTDGDKYWYLNGEQHREDGPAFEGANGTKEWYLNDKQIYIRPGRKDCSEVKDNE